MVDPNWQQLEDFAREELGRPLLGGKLTLRPETTLDADLRMTGLDAVEFIDKWVERFDISVKEFPYSRYFGPESLDVAGFFVGLFSKRARGPERMPLTLGMLAEAMRRGHWDTEEIEAAAGRAK
ncbi:acyl carrier protein [Burkholderia gladioli]|uniref:DUF1493 family protein n=1 Tax=Burkholderia TaxID=32008 RepID=UPI00050F8E14|nr:MULTISPECIES: DUF1493 family protein [Burkholderia]KGE11002.1 acyl carrier protein [Burkholderia gladioli]NIF88989.1 DUF1493 family protein [Burkholderia sp. Cy-637]